MKRLCVGVIGLAVLVGCGGPGSFDGSVAGNRLNTKSAIFLMSSNVLMVLLTDVDGTCAKIKAGQLSKNMSSFVLGIVQQENNTFVTPTPGDYAIIGPGAAAPSKFAVGSFGKSDANCRNTLTDQQSQANGGTLKLSSYKAEAGGTAVGTFEVTVGSQADKAKGSFNAEFCDFSRSQTTCV